MYLIFFYLDAGWLLDFPWPKIKAPYHLHVLPDMYLWQNMPVEAECLQTWHWRNFGSCPMPSETNCREGMLDFFLVLRWRREMKHLRQCGYGADLHIPIDKVGCWHTWTASGISLWADPNFCGQIHLTAEWWCSLRKFNHDYGKKRFDDFWKCSITNRGCQINNTEP